MLVYNLKYNYEEDPCVDTSASGAFSFKLLKISFNFH